MGWLFYHREKGESNIDHFNAKFTGEPKLIDAATVGGVMYGALRMPDGKVTAMIVLTRWVPNDYYNFGYKDMDEGMGPNEVGAPKRIMDLLSPVEDLYEGPSAEYATAWREAVYERLAKKERAKKVKKGMKVKFARPIHFTSGAKLDTLIFEGRDNFRDEAGYGARFRVTRWRERDFEVVA